MPESRQPPGRAKAILFIISIAAFVLMGPVAASNPPAFGDMPSFQQAGVGEDSSPAERAKGKGIWTKPEKEESSERAQAKAKSDIDLSLPNIGLKDPDDIVWPYGDEFSYEANMGSLFGDMAGVPMETEIHCTNQSRKTGGKMTDRIEMSMSEYGMRMVMDIDIFAEYDENHRAISLGVTVEFHFYGSIPMPVPIPNPLFSYRGEVRDGKLFEDLESPPTMGIEDYHSEKQAPDDGFFLSGGSATPGLMALMLSALDLENEEASTIWVVRPMLGFFDEIDEASFIRVNVSGFDDCGREIREFWKDSRGRFDNWRPPDDVKTFVIYEEPFDPENIVSVTFAYIDDVGRLTRLEDISEGEAIFVELKNISEDRPWWGKRKSKQ